MSTTEHPDDFEFAFSDRNSEPRPRHKETEPQLATRLEVMKLEWQGPERPLMTDDQVDSLVSRISAAVVEAVMVRVKAETRDEVRAHMAEVMKQLAFMTGKVLD